MSASTVPPERRSALLNVVDIVIAPNAAFDRLRAVPTWVWAFAVAAVLGIVGTLLAEPAFVHALQKSLPARLAASPSIAKMSPEQQQRAIALQLKIVGTMTAFSWVAVPFADLITGLVQALIMTIANAVGKGTASFKNYFALSMHAAVVGTGLAALVLGIIVRLRGVDAFETTAAIQSVVPSLAMLAPGTHGGLAGFLGGINVFNVWAAVLLALGMQRMGRIAPAPAWVTAAIFVIATAGFAAWGAAQQSQ